MENEILRSHFATLNTVALMMKLKTIKSINYLA